MGAATLLTLPMNGAKRLREAIERAATLEDKLEKVTGAMLNEEKDKH